MATEYRYDHFTRRRLEEDRAFQAGREPGWQMPDFELPTVSGGRLRRSDFIGRRPVLLTFGSLTDPMTASAAPVLKRLHRERGEDVAFVTVYVREAHPGERLPQPATFEWKMRHARMLRERDAIPWTVAVDDLDGSLHRALGGNSNAAYLMDPNGNVAFRTLWSNDERVLRAALDAIACGPPDHPFERGRRVVPWARGLARADDVVRAAGPAAVEELRREAPLLFAAAEVAWVWRALTPLGRTALVAACLGLAGAAYGTWRLVAPSRRRRGRLGAAAALL
jgi:Iodothyronine deiodinase